MADREGSAAPDARALWLYSAALALIANLGGMVQWWHPYCDTQADGPGFFAWGVPLPYAEPTGVSSGEFVYLPHVLAFNLAICALAAFAVLRLVFRRKMPRLLQRVALLFFLLAAAFQWMTLAQLGRPGWTATLASDALSSYRPSAIALSAGHRPCDR